VRDGPLSWAEVLARHGSRRGILVRPDRASLLLDFGLSGYRNRRDLERITYEGEGLGFDQVPTGGNAALLECLSAGRALTVFERVRPGEWYDLGPHRVIAARFEPGEGGRRRFLFTLEPEPAAPG
jgi:hypothetical protein